MASDHLNVRVLLAWDKYSSIGTYRGGFVWELGSGGGDHANIAERVSAITRYA